MLGEAHTVLSFKGRASSGTPYSRTPPHPPHWIPVLTPLVPQPCIKSLLDKSPLLTQVLGCGPPEAKASTGFTLHIRFLHGPASQLRIPPQDFPRLGSCPASEHRWHPAPDPPANPGHTHQAYSDFREGSTTPHGAGEKKCHSTPTAACRETSPPPFQLLLVASLSTVGGRHGSPEASNTSS